MAGTVRNMGRYVGQRGLLKLPGRTVAFAVEATDAQLAWGAVRVLVQPVAGEGAMWVEAASVVWEVAK